MDEKRMNDFDKKIIDEKGKSLESVSIDCVQINIGTKCNQNCAHCHLSASTESENEMSRETMTQVIAAVKMISPSRLEITGGAPELNAHFREFVEELAGVQKNILVRTNLTVLLEPSMEELPEFYKNNKIHLGHHLPGTKEKKVKKRRGKEVNKKIIRCLK